MLGGTPAVLRLSDEVVAHAFSHGVHPRHTERPAAYWAEAWGGPPTFTGEHGTEPGVVRLHSGNGVHEDMAQRAIDCFASALDEAGVHDPALQRTRLAYFSWATARMAGDPASSADGPADMTLPHWSMQGLEP